MGDEALVAANSLWVPVPCTRLCAFCNSSSFTHQRLYRDSSLGSPFDSDLYFVDDQFYKEVIH